MVHRVSLEHKDPRESQEQRAPRENQGTWVCLEFRGKRVKREKMDDKGFRGNRVEGFQVVTIASPSTAPLVFLGRRVPWAQKVPEASLVCQEEMVFLDLWVLLDAQAPQDEAEKRGTQGLGALGRKALLVPQLMLLQQPQCGRGDQG
ncbi:hypothetical protein CB1_000602034 [Camelus ferus]|nr:hypothetical protein CB1_000602034 [Camelus ferus]